MISFKKWGEYKGRDVFLYTLENQKGMKVSLTNFGCAVTEIQCKGIDVALGYDQLEGYINQSCYLGVVVGRYANRIRNARFTLNGSEYTLGRNHGNHHLHGGFVGFDKVLWELEEMDEDLNAVRFSYISKDGEEGYPGNLTVRLTYSLDEACALKIEYEAESDQPTIVNLANHTYFNLSGHDSGTIEDQRLKIYSNYFLENDAECIPTGTLLPVSGTPFNFKEFHKIGERIDSDDIQLKNGNGYDHNFILEYPSTNELRLVAEAFSDDTDIHLQVYTTMPGLQFYSGNSLNESFNCKDGAVYGRRSGFCLETQFWPDAVNHPDFPQPILLPGQIYRHSTINHFKY